MRSYYLFKSGRISRENNTLAFEYREDGDMRKVRIPIEDIDSIYVFGETDLNTKCVNFLSQHRVVIHFFNYYGWYTGSFYPKEFLLSGDLLVRQAEHYLNAEKRLAVARQFVEGGAYGMTQNLKRHAETTGKHISAIEELRKSLENQTEVAQLMGVEGNIRETYYEAFPAMFSEPIEFEKRVKHPPDNMINALISFMNGLVYAEILKEIYKTQLNPTIGYLHEPSERRFTLSLDVAEIFKPILADRILFEALNNRKLKKEHFDKDLNYAYLLEEGRKIVVREFEAKLNTTLMHKSLKRKVSYRRLIRLELYKLTKHFLGEKTYKSLRIWQ